MTVTIPSLNCHQCGHRWIPRKASIVKCPRCQSKKWNTKTKKKKKAS